MSDASATLLLLGDATAPAIPKPTRDQVCGVQNSFQGLTVSTAKFGPDRPWFDPDVTQCDLLEDRNAFYAAHRVAGDTHVNLSLDLGGIATLPHVLAIAKEAIEVGGMTGIILCCMGDGHGQPNSDPGSLGLDWLMADFLVIYSTTKAIRVGDHSLADHVIFVPGYDGVVPDWQPPSAVDRFLLMARAVIDDGGCGYLGLELSAGYSKWGTDDGIERNNWISPAGKAVDVILLEGPIDMGPPEPVPFPVPPAPAIDRWSQCYQIAARLIDPFHHVPGQTDDLGPYPHYTAEGTPRGRFYVVWWEFDTYAWTLPWRRGGSGIPLARVQMHRQAARAMGFAYVG